MTAKELERLERIAVQILAGYNANPIADEHTHESMAAYSIQQAQELIKQLDALKIPE